MTKINLQVRGGALSLISHDSETQYNITINVCEHNLETLLQSMLFSQRVLLSDLVFKGNVTELTIIHILYFYSLQNVSSRLWLLNLLLKQMPKCMCKRAFLWFGTSDVTCDIN